MKLRRRLKRRLSFLMENTLLRRNRVRRGQRKTKRLRKEKMKWKQERKKMTRKEKRILK